MSTDAELYVLPGATIREGLDNLLANVLPLRPCNCGNPAAALAGVPCPRHYPEIHAALAVVR